MALTITLSFNEERMTILEDQNVNLKSPDEIRKFFYDLLDNLKTKEEISQGLK